MQPKIAEEIPKEDWDLFNEIRQIIMALPARIPAPAFILNVRLPRSIAESSLIPNCHMITHALAKFFPVEAHDGVIPEIKPGGKHHRHEHSWLTRKGGGGKIIIDPWPLGAVSGPALFVQDYGFHFGNECSLLYHQTKIFKWQVAAVRLAIRKIIKEKSRLQAAT